TEQLSHDSGDLRCQPMFLLRGVPSGAIPMWGVILDIRVRGEYGCLKKYLSYSFNLSMKIILHRTRSAYPVAESVYKGHYSGQQLRGDRRNLELKLNGHAQQQWNTNELKNPRERVAPDSYAGSAVLRTVSRGRLFAVMVLAPPVRDEFTGARNRRWAEAVGTLATLRAWGGRLDVVTCSAAVSACERAQPSQWPRALRMLRETPEDPNEFTFSAAASACEKANLWQNSLGLLFELRRTPRKRGTPSEQGPKSVLQPTVVSHAATLSACAGGEGLGLGLVITLALGFLQGSC
ncbi:unnamed protein product, partial [Symbiodinium microadriaticum]